MVYGDCTVAGVIGARFFSDSTKNLDLGVIFCFGEQASVDKIYLNDEEIYPSNTHSTWISSISVQTGTGAEAVPSLLTAFLSAGEQSRWQANYCYVSLRIDTDHEDAAASGLNFTAEVGGRKIHDFRDVAYPADTTAAHTNPVLIAFDIMTDSAWTDVSTSRIDYAGTWTDVADWCDETIPGDSSKRFHFIGVMRERIPSAAIMTVLAHCFATPYFDNEGKMKLWSEGPPAAIGDYLVGDEYDVVHEVTAIPDDDTITTSPAGVNTSVKLRRLKAAIKKRNWVAPPAYREKPYLEIPDEVIVRYTLPDYDGNVQYPAPADLSGDKRSEVTLRGCRSATMAKRWSETRDNLNVASFIEWTGELDGEGAQLEPGDVVVFWDDVVTKQTAKVLPPVEWNQKDGTYSVHLLRYSHAAFSDGYQSDPTPPIDSDQGWTAEDGKVALGDLSDVDTSGTAEKYVLMYDTATSTYTLETITTAPVLYDESFQGYDSLGTLRNLIGVGAYASVADRIIIGAENNLEIVITSPLGADLYFNDNDEGIAFGGYGSSPALYRATDGYLCLDFSHEVEGIRIDPGSSGGRVIIGGIGDYAHLAIRQSGQLQGYEVGGTRRSMVAMDTSDRVLLGAATNNTIIQSSNSIQLGTSGATADLYTWNAKKLYWRNAADTAWLDALTVDASNRLVIGAASTFAVTRIYGSDANYLTIGASISNPYNVYMTTNATYLYGQETGGSNRVLIGMTGGNQVRIGQNTNRLTMYSSGNVYLYGAGLRLDNSYYIYGLNNAATAANPLIGVDSTDTTVVGNVGFDTLIKGSYTRFDGEHWEDVKVAVNTVRVPASAAPGWAAFQGGQILWFDASSDESVYFTVLIPHSYKEGSDIYPHAHWTPGSSTNTGAVRWGLEYSWANVNTAFPAATTVYCTDAGSGTANDNQVAEFPAAISGTGKDIGSILVCRLFRDANDAADTFTADAGLLEFDFHIQVDAIGSDAETSKT
jgi:hypothetical protein